MNSIRFLLFLALLAAPLTAADPVPRRAWPFRQPTATRPPRVQGDAWIRNTIDRFILSKLESAQLAPAPAAPRHVLLRRVYFDLVGVPPTPEEFKSFLGDTSKNAYERVVDRLLQDPRYGERWARPWLDLARYADTAGYEGDPDLPHAGGTATT